MRIGVYNPYLESGMGGGERYVLTLAAHWSKNHKVSIFCDNLDIKKSSLEMFKIDISNTQIVHNFFRTNNLLKKLYQTTQYDVIFFLTDGSIPSSLARYNILHFQIPFQHLENNPFKISRFSTFVCNSLFTKNNLPVGIKYKAIVIYPPVDIDSCRVLPKEKIILSVGRFNKTKKQHVLIQAFSEFLKKRHDHRLIIVGGLIESDGSYFNELKERSRELAITLLPNCSNTQLAHLYGKASLYWHAAGFGETNPELMEHFGISTVEAMASKAIPVVFQGGGQPEIVNDGKNGYLWSSVEELLEKSSILLNSQDLLTSFRENAWKSAKSFNQEIFCDKYDQLLHQL